MPVLIQICLLLLFRTSLHCLLLCLHPGRDMLHRGKSVSTTSPDPEQHADQDPSLCSAQDQSYLRSVWNSNHSLFGPGQSPVSLAGSHKRHHFGLFSGLLFLLLS